MSGETIDRAKGRWREILPRLGIETRFLTNKHGPCPLCGGKDRFRFDDKDGSGSYYCNQCGPGNGVLALRKLHGWTFAQACTEIDKIIGTEPRKESPAAPRSIGPATHRGHAIRRAIALATRDEIVTAYLTKRGLSVSSSALRGDAAHPYYGKDDESERSKLIGHFPAVLAPITGPDGKLQSCMRIYDAANLEPRKKIMEPVATISGGAVRLFEESDILAITEGIETGLAVHELFNIPVWSVLSTSGMKSFEPPPKVRELHIYGDNDSNFAGQAVAFTLANALVRKINDLKNKTALQIVNVHIPEQPDTDWLNVLLQSKRRAA